MWVGSGAITAVSACVSSVALTAVLHAPAWQGLIGAALALAIVYWQEMRVRELRGGLDLAECARQQFLANISHEIRTPLNAVQTSAELLARGSLTQEQRQMAALIQSNCESLIGIVNEMLDFASMEARELRLEEVPFDLASVVDSVAGRMAGRAREKGLAFELDVRSGVPHRIQGDPQRLRQVLFYLLDNAVKFTDKGKVRFEVSAVDKPAAALLFRIIDTGCGLAPDVADGLLRPFTQADSTATRKHGGIGLGLTLVYRLVTMMGGSVGVESRTGAGSTFWVLLPAHAAGAEPASKPRHGRVLIVDDNPVNLMVAARAVHNLGYASHVVSGGEAALDAMEKVSFDLILMDCQMPVLDGYETTKRLREREAATRQHIPIVAMTANALAGDEEKCLAAGMDDYLTKPIRLALLGRTLERWIPAAPRKAEAPRLSIGPPVAVGLDRGD